MQKPMIETVNLAGRRARPSSMLALTWLMMGALLVLPPLLDFPRAKAQENPAPTENEPGRPSPQRPRGRLPTYFARVVTAQQRETIYNLQAQYQEQLDGLLEQVRKLEQQRDMEVFQVLTPEQQQQVTAWTEEARQRRAGAGTRSTSTPPADSTDN